MSSLTIGQTIIVDTPAGKHVGRIVGIDHQPHHRASGVHYVVKLATTGEWLPVSADQCRGLAAAHEETR